MFVELRDSIESNCNKCDRQDTSACNECFFTSVDLGRKDLGGKRVYARAYHLLNCLKQHGFSRKDSFGTKLNVQLRKEVTV